MHSSTTVLTAAHGTTMITLHCYCSVARFTALNQNVTACMQHWPCAVHREGMAVGPAGRHLGIMCMATLLIETNLCHGVL